MKFALDMARRLRGAAGPLATMCYEAAAVIEMQDELMQPPFITRSLDDVMEASQRPSDVVRVPWWIHPVPHPLARRCHCGSYALEAQDSEVWVGRHKIAAYMKHTVSECAPA